MKVALLTDSDVFAGTERHILELAHVLSGLDCTVSVLCPSVSVLAERARAANLPVFPVEKRGPVDLAAIAVLRSALRRGQFDIVHTHNGRTSLAAALAAWLARRGQLVTTQHFLSPAHAALGGIKARIARAAHRWIAGRAARVIAISEAVRASILARRAAPPDRIRVVLNGVSDPQQSERRSRPQVRAEFGVAAAAPLIVTSARLEREKGVETLIEAMSQVRSACPAARCLVAGEGADRAGLQALLEKKGLADAVQLVGFRADIFSLIDAADVFVLPSPNEPFGLALIEAMGLSRPVIASRAGGPCEIVSDGESGLLFHPGDAADLGSKILQVITQPGLAARLAARARQTYADRFTSRRMADEIFALYREIVSVGQNKTFRSADRPGS